MKNSEDKNVKESRNDIQLLKLTYLMHYLTSFFANYGEVSDLGWITNKSSGCLKILKNFPKQ